MPSPHISEEAVDWPEVWLRRPTPIADLENYSVWGPASDDLVPHPNEDGEFRRYRCYVSAQALTEVREQVFREIRNLVPHEVPCNCPARGVFELSQHADECPRGAVSHVLAALNQKADRG